MLNRDDSFPRYGAAFAIVLLIAGGASAQSVEDILQATINAKGKACEKVTATNAIGTDTNGTPIIAAACSDGGRYVLEINATGTAVTYVSTCSTFTSVSGIECF